MKILTMRGQHIDMARLIAQNSHQTALGNASMNARGDLIGDGGVVIKLREDIAREYHKTNPKIVKQVALRELPDEAFVTPDQWSKEIHDTVKENADKKGELTDKKPKRNLTNE